MSNVLVIAEQLEGKLKKSSLHALAAGQQLAGRTGGKVVALLLGKGIGEAAAELAAHGPAEVLAADDAKVEHALAEVYSKAIEKAVKDTGATFVIAATTSQGKDVLPRVAARLSAGMASDVIAFGGSGADVSFKRPMWAGSVIAEVEISTPVK
ncbi:MAG TPA: electron transfer flavoprotein subunit alpha/FixB family protein, partial [Vulgatibacter sp.]